MTRTRVASTALALLLGVVLTLGTPVVAQKLQQWIQGGGYAGRISEKPFSFLHNSGKPLAVTVERELFKVPTEYGEPFAVTVSGTQQVVWYRHPELGVRNVIVERDRTLVQLLQQESRQETLPTPDPAAR